MSEQNRYSSHFVCGVIKFDYKVAGFRDLITVAQEWAKDENFYELIVRSVSDKNFGLQFTYYAEGTVGGWFGDTYIKPLLAKFPSYAVDVAYDGRTREEVKAEVLDGVVVSKSLPIGKVVKE
ncbi:MAG: hypothetical protein QY318_04835 [Candidatus Dojkabacteria bacterium]|nr:MAG: hypothetical protein QY318_04835 [Candidatus Dojkabacteria bacterium]